MEAHRAAPQFNLYVFFKKIATMKILSRGITQIHIVLFLLFTFTWLAFADAYKVPKFMFSYIFPYEFAFRGMGIAVIYIIVFQALVIGSYIAALMNNKRKGIVANSIATIVAIVWFLFANISVLAAHIH